MANPERSPSSKDVEKDAIERDSNSANGYADEKRGSVYDREA